MKIFFSFIFIAVFSLTTFAATVCSGNKEKSALIIIDMQPYFVTRGGKEDAPENKKKVEEVLNEQVQAINRAKEAGIPIVLIEYSHESLQFGETNSVLKGAVGNYKETQVMKKNTDGMFDNYNKYREELVGYLQKKKIGTLLITGANGGACVERSIRGALDNNCDVVALNKGIADFNYKDFIYPYKGYYAKISSIAKPRCDDCKFKEVTGIESANEYLVGNSSNALPVNQNRTAEGAE